MLHGSPRAAARRRGRQGSKAPRAGRASGLAAGEPGATDRRTCASRTTLAARVLRPRAILAALGGAPRQPRLANTPVTDSSSFDAPRVPAPTTGGVLALGFGTAVAMWGAAYFCRLSLASASEVVVPGWVLALLFALCYLAGGALAARTLPGPAAWAGARVGALASLLDLLILGSVLSEHGSRLALLGALGTLAVGAALGAAGALAARARGWAPSGPVNWTSALARVAIAATFLLLGVGGLVTSNDAGLAVPDWPNTFASNMFLYPLSRMTGGIFYEHSHRLFGALVGLATLAVAVQVTRTDDRRWVRALVWALFVLVCAQGFMGGLRVTGKLTLSADRAELAPNAALGMVHGITAQLFFSGLVALAAFVSTSWRAAPPAGTRDPQEEREALEGTRDLTGGLVALLVAQLALGALVRHFHTGLALHITCGVGALLLAIACGARAWGVHEDRPVLPAVGVALTWVIGLQFLLGMGSYATTALAPGESLLSAYQAPVTTVHQTCGAAVLALALLTHLWSRRALLALGPAAPAEVAASRPS